MMPYISSDFPTCVWFFLKCGDFTDRFYHQWKTHLKRGSHVWWIRQSRYKTKKWFQKLDKETEIMSDQR